MRILQISDKAPHDGGAGAYVAGMAAQLEAHGHRVDNLRLEDGIPTGPGQTAPGTLGHRLPTSYGPIQGRRLRHTLRLALAATRPELVHVHECFTTFSAVLLSELRRYGPVVGTLHDVRPFCYLMTRRFTPTGAVCVRRCGITCFSSGCVQPAAASDFLRLPRRWLVDRMNLEAWRNLDRVVVPSTYLYELALQHGLPASKLRLVPHGTAVPSRPPRKAEGSDPALIVFLGGLIDYKGPGLLVEALAHIRERSWHAILLGEGPMRGALEHAVERLGLRERVSLPGYVADRGKVDEFLTRARLLALPSLVPESFSLAGIEALAMGTPVVSFGLGGVREWLSDDVNGLIAADGDARDFAQRMARLLDDPALAETLGKRGHELVTERFSTARMVNGLLAVYGELSRAGA